MNREEVVEKIGEIIEEASGIPPESITEATAFVEDLELDSLSLLQVAVDVDYAFRLDLPEEALLGLPTVGRVVDVVLAREGNAAVLPSSSARVA